MFNLTFDYAYISDPPILADIGSAFLLVDNMSFVFDAVPNFNNNNQLTIDMKQFDLSMDDFNLDFDGLSDISIVATDAINSIAGVVGHRFRSML